MEKHLNKQIPKYADLISGVFAIMGSIIVFTLFLDFTVNSVGSHRVYIFVKPGYSSLGWAVFSLSSMMYYCMRTNWITSTGGYINPLFSGFIKIMNTFPFIGFIFSCVNGTDFILQSQSWNMIMKVVLVFFDNTLILFVAVNFYAGVASIKRFFMNKPIFSL